MQKMNADDIALNAFKPGDLVRWIGEWQFPLVDAPPRDNTVLAIRDDGMVWLEGRHGGERAQQWGCPPEQLVHREASRDHKVSTDRCPSCGEQCGAYAGFYQGSGRLPLPDHGSDVVARLKLEHNEANATTAKRLRNIMSTCFDGSRSGDLAFQLADMEEWIPKFTSEWKANHRRWLELCTRLGLDALDLERRGRVAEVDAVAGGAIELKRIRSIVDEDARKRHGDRRGEPSWGVIADCILAHVSQHRQAREILGVPEQVTLDQYVSMLGDGAELVATRQVLEAMQGRTPDPARSTVQLAREVVDQAERWRIDAEHYRGARLTGEVAATRAEAARQIGARDAALAALVTRAQRLATDLTSEANECTAHGLVSPATALRGAAAFLTSLGERVPRVFSDASSVEALHLRLEEADRHLAGLQEEAKRRDEALREETRKVIEYSNLVDQYKRALAQVQGVNAAAVSVSLGSAKTSATTSGPPSATSNAAGKFIVIDGPDGAGKTTLAMALAERIGAMLTREPRYDTTRALLFAEAAASPVELAIAMAHDRFQHLRHEVEPALQQGRTVVCDRYVLSTLAYQHEALAGIVGDEVVGFLVLGAREPDLTIVVDIDPTTAAARQSSKARDRFEDDIDLRQRVRARYLVLAEQRGYPVISGRESPREVLDQATALFDKSGILPRRSK